MQTAASESPPPFDRGAQQLTARHWRALLDGGDDDAPITGARELVYHSWQRSRAAAVDVELARAPLVLDADGVALTRARTEWLPFAERALAEVYVSPGDGHIVSIFDPSGRMIHADGDPRAREGLFDINFRPGALWTEAAAGTNGPGTALAVGRPVHIVGAEHYCTGWQPWHCAAAPIRDQTTGEICGVLDISGFADRAHPHTLALVLALAGYVERALAARDLERRVTVLQRMTALVSRYPADAAFAVDRAGRVLGATHGAPAGLRPESEMPRALRAALATFVRGVAADGSPHDAYLPLNDELGLTAVAHPVTVDGTPVGAVLVLPQGGLLSPPGAAPPSPRRAPPAGIAPSHQTPSHQTPSHATRVMRSTRYSFLDIVGAPGGLAEQQRVATIASSNSLPVLLLGESGVGKEVFAQAIHAASARRDAPFVAVNCGSLPRELVDSELFGYVGGAFSGARREGSAGKFEAAEGGTIFLDEIGELPSAAQASLLRVLQEGEVTRVGAVRGKRVDVRVIAATNRPISTALSTGDLRRDLYYRLNVLSIELPPLRERRRDILPLTRYFLAAACEELGRDGISLAPSVLDAFERYDWPGNVRELSNTVRRLVALAGPITGVRPADLPEPLRGIALASPASSATSPDVPSDAPRTDVVADVSADLSADVERDRLIAAVAAAPTMAEAARRLGIDRSTLYRRMSHHGLRPRRTLREADGSAV